MFAETIKGQIDKQKNYQPHATFNIFTTSNFIIGSTNYSSVYSLDNGD